MKDIRFDAGTGIKISNLGFTSVVREKNFSFESIHGRENFSFVFVQKGEMQYKFKGIDEMFILKERETLFTPMHIPYNAQYTKPDTTIKTISFNVNEEKLPSFIPALPQKKSSKEYASVFDSVTPVNMRNPLFLAAKAYELLYLMQIRKSLYTKNQKKILPALNEIYENYSEKHPISYYADMCNMSESNFRRLFKEWTGISPIEFRNMLRIEEAGKLIDSGEFTVEEAAWYVGFNNMSFFYELCRKRKII